MLCALRGREERKNGRGEMDEDIGGIERGILGCRRREKEM